MMKLEHWKKISVLLIIYDMVAVSLSYAFALWIRFDGIFSKIPFEYWQAYLSFIPIYSICTVIVFLLFHLYQCIWRFIGYNELIKIIEVTLITIVIHFVGITVFFRQMPISYYVIGAIVQFCLTVGIRFSYRIYLKFIDINKNPDVKKCLNIMIIGAGEAGQIILRDIIKTDKINTKICCIIDDNKNKWGRTIDGVSIVGGRDDILLYAQKYQINQILFAIPSAALEEKRNILGICNETDCEVKVLPGSYQFVTDEVSISKMRDISFEDLLGREPIHINTEEIIHYVKDKVILVTGGGGSIGSELCRQIARHNPKKLIIFDIYENNAYSIEQELKSEHNNLDLVTLIGSVRDSRRINNVFEKYHPDVVYHAAAHKHVPIMENSPCEAIKNNVIGTYKTAYAALMNNCSKFVLISTDKAVNPTNIMGASKRLCEMVIQSMNVISEKSAFDKLPILHTHDDKKNVVCSSIENLYSKSSPQNQFKARTEFVAVRFGNVLGSNGSVIPIFRKQIAEGGPVTVTHPDIIRYFMTIPEAVGLVLQAGVSARGGEIFVLDMGAPIKIDTLARNLIKCSGYKPDVDIKIIYTGLRPGEKIYEEKLMAEEGLKRTKNKLIFIGQPIPFDKEKFFEDLEYLSNASYNNSEDIISIVENIVTTFHPVGENGQQIDSWKNIISKISVDKEVKQFVSVGGYRRLLICKKLLIILSKYKCKNKEKQ